MPEIPADLSALSADELAQLEATAVAAFNDNASDDADDETVAQLTALADGIDRVRAESAARATASAEKRSTLSSLAERVNANAEGQEGEQEASKENEGEAPAEAPKETKTEETTTETKTEESKPAEATTASISQMKAKAPARTQPRPVAPSNDTVGEVTITAAAGVPGHMAGDNLKDLHDVGRAIVQRQKHLGKGDGDDVPVVSFNLNVPDERRLTRDDNVLDRLAEFDMSPEGIVAAGGLCAPVNNYYGQTVVAESARPVRDSLANFTADRGGIRFNPSPKLASVSAGTGVGLVTAAQDASNATKTCFTVTCPSIQEVDIVAIYNCLTFGNFSARTFPEQVEAWTSLQLAWQARVSEQFLLDQIAANSTTVTTVGLVGAGRELFARYGQAAAGMRNRNRMLPNAPIRVLLPAWTLDLVQADFARTFTDENGLISMTQQDITALFGTRNLNVSWYMDSKTGGNQIMGASGPNGGQSFTDGVTNGTTTVTSATAAFTSADVGKTITGTNIPAGATIASVTNATTVVISAAATGSGTGITLTVGRTTLAQFPTTVYGYMFPEGSFLHLDGGTLDLGLVRDSTLNSTNQFRMFSENFEQVAFIGVESLEIVSTLNADGSYAAARSITLPINS